MQDSGEGFEKTSAPGGVSECRALVLRSDLPEFGPARADARAPADFVTQLLACEGRLAPYRSRRRAEPREALSLYRNDPTRAGAAAAHLVRVL